MLNSIVVKNVKSEIDLYFYLFISLESREVDFCLP
jgi:hypothetical protein